MINGRLGLINVEVKNYENLRYDSEKNLFYLISAKLDYSNVKLKFITKNCDGLMIADNKINCDNFIELNISKPLDVIVYKDEETKIYTIQGLDIGLPIININTECCNNISNDWQIADISIYDENKNILINENINIKVRGAVSKNFIKKSYNIKFNKKTSILGMLPGKKWCLLANYQDPTLIKTDVAFFISKKTNLKYTPNGKFVVFILNGKEFGIYYICEKPTIDENRINVNKFNINDLNNSGFLLYADFSKKQFIRTKGNKSIIIKYPKFKDENEEKIVKEYLTNTLNNIEDYLFINEINISECSKYVDIDSLVEYILLAEIISHNDLFASAGLGRNIYMYLNKGKLYFGPIWDLDALTFSSIHSWAALQRIKSNDNNGKQLSPNFINFPINLYTSYNKYIIYNNDFIKMIIHRWNEIKIKLNDINEYIDLLYDKLKIAYI